MAARKVSGGSPASFDDAAFREIAKIWAWGSSDKVPVGNMGDPKYIAEYNKAALALLDEIRTGHTDKDILDKIPPAYLKSKGINIGAPAKAPAKRGRPKKDDAKIDPVEKEAVTAKETPKEKAPRKPREPSNKPTALPIRNKKGQLTTLEKGEELLPDQEVPVFTSVRSGDAAKKANADVFRRTMKPKFLRAKISKLFGGKSKLFDSRGDVSPTKSVGEDTEKITSKDDVKVAKEKGASKRGVGDSTDSLKVLNRMANTLTSIDKKMGGKSSRGAQPRGADGKYQKGASEPTPEVEVKKPHKRKVGDGTDKYADIADQLHGPSRLAMYAARGVTRSVTSIFKKREKDTEETQSKDPKAKTSDALKEKGSTAVTPKNEKIEFKEEPAAAEGESSGSGMMNMLSSLMTPLKSLGSMFGTLAGALKPLLAVAAAGAAGYAAGKLINAGLDYAAESYTGKKGETLGTILAGDQPDPNSPEAIKASSQAWVDKQLADGGTISKKSAEMLRKRGAEIPESAITEKTIYGKGNIGVEKTSESGSNVRGAAIIDGMPMTAEQAKAYELKTQLGNESSPEVKKAYDLYKAQIEGSPKTQAADIETKQTAVDAAKSTTAQPVIVQTPKNAPAAPASTSAAPATAKVSMDTRNSESSYVRYLDSRVSFA